MSEQPSGYRKNWGKWILIYLAIAAVVYGVVYLVFFTGGNGGGGGGGY